MSFVFCFLLFLQHRYGHNPTTLYHLIRHCLHQEMTLVQKAEMASEANIPGPSHSTSHCPPVASAASAASTSDAAYQIHEQLSDLKKATTECGLEIEKTRQLQENHSINFYKHHQISGERDFVCRSNSVKTALQLRM